MQRIEAQRDIAVVGGWIAGIESRTAKPHKLDELLAMFRPKPKSRSEPMTNEQLRMTMKAWVAATGGTFADGTDSVQ